MLTQSEQRDVDNIDTICLAGNPDDPADVETDMYDWGAPIDGNFLLFDGDRAVGEVSVHKTASEYDGQIYCLGGLGGLAVLPEYRGRGYGRLLAEAALRRASEIGVDVACMCVNMESGITDFYRRLGYRFLGRPAYFTSWADKIKTDDTVMIMGINNKWLAEKILTTSHRFHYGANKGHW